MSGVQGQNYTRRTHRGRRAGKKTKHKKSLNEGSKKKSTIRIFNLSQHPLTNTEIKVLEKGLHFAPCAEPDNFDLFVDLNKFVQKLTIQRHFSMKKEDKDNKSENFRNSMEQIEEKTTLKAHAEVYEDVSEEEGSTTNDWMNEGDKLSAEILESLWDGRSQAIEIQDSNDPSVKHTNLKRPSNFYPQASRGHFINTFYRLVEKEFKSTCQETPRRRKHNLSKQERESLWKLKENTAITIRQADKGGGLVIQDTEDYLREVSRLLRDKDTYDI